MARGRTPAIKDYDADALRQEFRVLADQWYEETGHLSSPKQIAMHFAYQRIIGKGPRVLPLIFEELQAGGGQWYWALRAITGENPVHEDHAGKVALMKKDWLNWAHDHDFVA